MLQTKRGADDGLIENLTESSKKSRICTGEGGKLHGDGSSTSAEQIESDSGQSVWSDLSEEVTSKLSRNIVSIAVCADYGETVIFACSGIAIQSQLLCTRFLTSASLVRAFNKSKNEGHENLQIVVSREGNVSRGLLGDYNLDQGIALVSLKFFRLGVHPVNLYHHLEFISCTKVISVTRAATGKIMARSGVLTVTDDSSGSENGTGLMFSTCKISEAWEGGALFDYDGNFVAVQKPDIQPWPYMSFTRDRFEDIDSKGYPKQSTTIISEGLILVNNFEDPFGDVYGSGKGVWRQLSRTICYNLPRYVVSLASYSGETRFFACTGLFIEWNGCTPILTSASLVSNPNDGNKIAENLKITVLLPNNQFKEGILQHYNLHYNVALVGVDFHPLRPARILEDKWDPKILENPNVVAVGRCFESGALMATHGTLNSWSGTLDYRDLRYSSCKITKAGIGGPLIDFSGRFVGMNFYDKKIGTPYMFRRCIIRVLAHFEGKRNVDEVGRNGKPIRWPVPMPCWRHPDDEIIDSCPPGDGEESGRFGFTYVDGDRLDFL